MSPLISALGNPIKCGLVTHKVAVDKLFSMVPRNEFTKKFRVPDQEFKRLAYEEPATFVWAAEFCNHKVSRRYYQTAKKKLEIFKVKGL